MSPPELLVALRQATPPAPARLQERVRTLAATAAPPPRRRPGRRVVVGFALAATATASAALVGTLVLPRGGSQGEAVVQQGTPFAPRSAAVAAAGKASSPPQLRTLAPSVGAAAAALPAPSPGRAQRYGATLDLRLPDGSAVAAAARGAVRIAARLGGYSQSVHVSVGARAGEATVVLRVPRARVGTAIDRLSALGRVVGEQASISDLQSGVDQSGRQIVRLERELAAALNGPQTPLTRRLATALSTRIETLQRARAATLRSARDATVTLRLSTPPRVAARPHARPGGHGPFHELGVAFRLAGIGIVYALALGAPLAVLAVALWLGASRLRRRRVERLLSRS